MAISASSTSHLIPTPPGDSAWFTSGAGKATSKASPTASAHNYEMVQLSGWGNREEEGPLALSPEEPSPRSFTNRYQKGSPVVALSAAVVATTTLAIGAGIRNADPNTTEVDRTFLGAAGLSTIIATTLVLTHNVLNTPQPSVVRKAIASATGAAAAGCITVLGVGVSKPDFDHRRPFLWAGGVPIVAALFFLMGKEAYLGRKGPQQIDDQQKFLSKAERPAYFGFVGLSLTSAIAAAAVLATDKNDFGHFKNEAIIPAILGSLGFLLMITRHFLHSRITNKSQTLHSPITNKS